jgi:integrase
MRSGEALSLKIGQVDLQERTILLTKTKRGKSRRVPLNEIAYEPADVSLQDERRMERYS